MKTTYTTLQGVAIGLLANGIMPFFKGIVDLASCAAILIALGILYLIEERE